MLILVCGEYQKAIEQENLAKTIVEVLYPNDNHYAGKELRLKQQYFFISASLQELIAKYKRDHDDIKKLYEEYLGKPGSEKAHHLLHTKYHEK